MLALVFFTWTGGGTFSSELCALWKAWWSKMEWLKPDTDLDFCFLFLGQPGFARASVSLKSRTISVVKAVSWSVIQWTRDGLDITTGNIEKILSWNRWGMKGLCGYVLRVNENLELVQRVNEARPIWSITYIISNTIVTIICSRWFAARLGVWGQATTVFSVPCLMSLCRILIIKIWIPLAYRLCLCCQLEVLSLRVLAVQSCWSWSAFCVIRQQSKI